jgi:hypothetical protein
MSRSFTACLALVLTAGGWFVVPATGTGTGHDFAYFAPVAVASAGSHHSDHDQQAPALPALLAFAGVQVPRIIVSTVVEYRSCTVVPPPYFCLGPRPPPQNS